MWVSTEGRSWNDYSIYLLYCFNTAVCVYELKNILQSREIFLYKLPGESHNDNAFINDLWPIIIIKHIYIAQVWKVHKCAMSAEMAAWLVTVYVSIAIYITNYQDS